MALLFVAPPLLLACGVFCHRRVVEQASGARQSRDGERIPGAQALGVNLSTCRLPELLRESPTPRRGWIASTRVQVGGGLEKMT